MAANVSDATAAAGERRRQVEEEMVTYSKEDLADDWEFKIVRSSTAAFRNPATLEKLRQEEARAGWVMVEKFDDARVRFKRPCRARENDSRLPQGADPYRANYGMNPYALMVILLNIILGVLGLVFVCVGFFPILSVLGFLHY